MDLQLPLSDRMWTYFDFNINFLFIFAKIHTRSGGEANAFSESLNIQQIKFSEIDNQICELEIKFVAF